MQEGRILVRLSFLLNHVEKRKKYRGERKAKIYLKRISDEVFECLHFELVFFAIYSASSAGTFSG